MTKQNGPRILILDIETAPILGYVWQIWEQNVGLNQIKADWYVLSWAARWLDDTEGKVMYMDQRNKRDIEDDTTTLGGVWRLIDKADIVITQNGVSFDIKKLNARFILKGFPPPSPFKNIDTKLIASKVFGFTSNKLEYMTDKLCTTYKKLKHKKFEGFELWKECLSGNKEAWNEMEVYNKHDVLSLEELWRKLAPWDNRINFSLYSDGTDNKCQCGSTDFQKRGFQYTATAKYQRFRCQECGAWSHDNINLLGKDKIKSLHKNCNK